MTGNARRSTLLLLGVILGGHALLWWPHPFAFLYEIDSQHYARLAAEILLGQFELAPQQFNDRFAVTVPTAAIYGILGIGARATTLWTLLASLATIVIVFWAADRAFGGTAGLLAALLLAANPVQVQYAAHLLPDVIASAFMVGAATLLFAAREAPSETPRRTWLRGGLCALVLIAGLLAKKTILWLFPFFAGVLVWDLARRRHQRLWQAIVITGGALLTLYCFAYYLATGDPFRVVSNVETSHNLSRLASFYGRTGARYLERLTSEPLEFVLEQLGYGFLLVLAAPALLHLVRPRRAMPRGLRFWAAYAALILACFWFGTTSLRSYNPLPVSPRHMIPLLAPLAVLGGTALAALLSADRDQRQAGRPAIAAAFVAAATAWLLSLPERVVVYALLGLTLSLPLWLPRLLPVRAAKAVSLVLFAALPLGILVHYEQQGGVKEPNPLRVRQNLFVRRQIGRLPQGSVVLTDDHSAFVLPFLLEQRGRAGRVRIVDWNDAAAVRAHAGAPAYLLLDQVNLSMTHEWFGRRIPWFAYQPPRRWHRLAVRRTRWRGSGPDRSRRPFRVARIALLELDDPAELLVRGPGRPAASQ